MGIRKLFPFILASSHFDPRARSSHRGRFLPWLVGAVTLCSLMSGCASGLEVGHFTVLSTKVYDGNKTYAFLGRFQGSSHPLLGDGNVEEAVDDALRKAPGGIYMTNVLVKHGGFPSGYDVLGDIYGIVSGPSAANGVEVP
jgi:hypothetical protein